MKEIKASSLPTFGSTKAIKSTQNRFKPTHKSQKITTTAIAESPVRTIRGKGLRHQSISGEMTNSGSKANVTPILVDNYLRISGKIDQILETETSGVETFRDDTLDGMPVPIITPKKVSNNEMFETPQQNMKRRQSAGKNRTVVKSATVKKFSHSVSKVIKSKPFSLSVSRSAVKKSDNVLVTPLTRLHTGSKSATKTTTSLTGSAKKVNSTAKPQTTNPRSVGTPLTGSAKKVKYTAKGIATKLSFKPEHSNKLMNKLRNAYLEVDKSIPQKSSLTHQDRQCMKSSTELLKQCQDKLDLVQSEITRLECSDCLYKKDLIDIVALCDQLKDTDHHRDNPTIVKIRSVIENVPHAFVKSPFFKSGDLTECARNAFAFRRYLNHYLAVKIDPGEIRSFAEKSLSSINQEVTMLKQTLSACEDSVFHEKLRLYRIRRGGAQFAFGYVK